MCQQAFELSQQRPIHSHVVTDAQALDACERFLLDHRILVEPACGAALALAYVEACAGKGDALRRERAIKRLPKRAKEALIAAGDAPSFA